MGFIENQEHYCEMICAEESCASLGGERTNFLYPYQDLRKLTDKRYYLQCPRCGGRVEINELIFLPNRFTVNKLLNE